jgi:hypothetical protein
MIREALGTLKYKALDCWPYVMEEVKAKRLREEFRLRISELAPIQSAGRPSIEIHMLCGKYHVDMGIFAGWSFMRFLKNASLYIHSDGTLGEQDATIIRMTLPTAVIITSTEADKRVKETVAAIAPKLCEWRRSNFFAAQLIDMNLFGEFDRFLFLDADILCFLDPVELRTALMVEKPVFRWAQDLRSSYVAPVPVLRKMTQLHVPEAVNLGPMVVPRLGEKDFRYLEHLFQIFQADPMINMKLSWAPQTFYAICACRSPGSHPFSPSYALTRGRTAEEAIIRHYVSIPAIRPRFFTEGLPKIFEGLQ